MDREVYLGIETSTKFSSVAIIEEEKTLSEYSMYTPSNHNEKIFLMLEAVMEHTELKYDEIKGIGVSAGPGMFTSLRTGISIAKTLAFIKEIPIKAINTLDAIQAVLKIQAPVIVIIPAGKGEVYAGFYQNEEKKYLILKPEKIKDHVKKKTYITGPAVIQCLPFFEKEKNISIITPPILFPPASVVAFLAKERIKKEGSDDVFELEPFYLRPTDAEIHRDKKSNRR